MFFFYYFKRDQNITSQSSIARLSSSIERGENADNMFKSMCMNVCARVCVNVRVWAMQRYRSVKRVRVDECMGA